MPRRFPADMTYGGNSHAVPGQIKHMIDAILTQRSKGNLALRTVTATKLILKGVDPERYTVVSPDDPAVIARVRAIAAEWGVHV